ncbi:MAG: hypothetical protein ABH813_02915 [Patescibacteria group bacterium]
MKITESKNLKYDNWPLLHFEGPEKMEPSHCILSDFILSDNKIGLRFVNGSTAFLHSRNIEGESEIANIGKKLGEFTGKSYKEILEADF